jgi:hypothetical protein
MSFKPERAGGGKWICSNLLPPRFLISIPMDLAMMRAAEWHGEFGAHFAGKCARLRKA